MRLTLSSVNRERARWLRIDQFELMTDRCLSGHKRNYELVGRHDVHLGSEEKSRVERDFFAANPASRFRC